MLKKLKEVLLFGIVSSENKKSIRAQVMKENRRFAVIWSTAQLVYWTYCLVMSFRSEEFARCRGAYLLAIALCLLAWIFAASLARNSSSVTLLTALIVDAALLGASLWVARMQLLQPNARTILIFVSVLIVPLMFISDTLSNFLLALADVLIAFFLLKPGVRPEVYAWNVTNLAIMASIGVVMGHFINKARFERYVFSESAVQLADSNAKIAELQTKYAYYDQMTGLQNHRAYAERTEQLAREMPPYCCVIAADINGLKETNDEHGHEAGDELIIGAAECLRRIFARTDMIYRLGGDEFCVILTDAGTDVPRRLENLEILCADWKGKLIKGVSLSYGFASTKEFPDLDAILKAADQRMYAFKSNYYLTVGKDRRKL